jgi:hypothetical protein
MICRICLALGQIQNSHIMIEGMKKFLNEEQDPKAIEKIAGKLNELLMNEETVEYIAVQKKPAVTISPDCVALTNKRIIFCRSKNLGLAMDFQDYTWKEVADCQMKEGVFGAEFSIRTNDGTIAKIDYLPKAQARKLYSFAQEQEEKQRELKRQMELEAKRAGAQRITVSAPMPSSPAPQAAAPEEPKPAADDEITASLKKLKTLFENALITQEEYDAKKAEILARL